MKWNGNYTTAALPLPCRSWAAGHHSSVLPGPCCVLFWGTLLCESRSQNNSQRSVYAQNKGRNVKHERNHFSFLCLYFTALWKAISLFLQPRSHCIHCSASRASTLLLIISRFLFFQRAEFVIRHFTPLGKPKASKCVIPMSEWKVKIAAPFLIHKPKSTKVFQP